MDTFREERGGGKSAPQRLRIENHASVHYTDSSRVPRKAREELGVVERESKLRIPLLVWALIFGSSVWMLRDVAYDIFDWHDHPLAAGIVLSAPYTPRNTDDQ
ncbi:hypothetical protein JCM31271_31130 [Halorubrum trueperi]